MAEHSFLVEIGTEELPPKALPGLARSLCSGIIDGLKGADIEFSQTYAAFSPRRIAVQVHGLPARQADRRQRRMGPALSAALDKSGQPTRAALGFADSCGVKFQDLDREKTDKGVRLAHTQEIPGQETISILPGIVTAALARIPIPKRMRWGAGEAEFVRPVHWIVMLFDDLVIDCSVFGIQAGRSTRGHRFMSPSAFDIPAATIDYPALLAAHGRVRVNDGAGTLTEWIRSSVQDEAVKLGGTALGLDGGLPEEVASLVEWPVPVVGHFDERFLALPPEVLVTTLQHHQRYFPVMREGALLPNFITFANIESADPAVVRLGNERVVTPRLEDAAFFFDRDRAVTLASRSPALDAVVFQQKLGSLRDKSARLVRLAPWIAGRMGEDVALAERAALLSKCDLLTGMVGEFPELQGVMGHHYATHDGEQPGVSLALREQYLPRHAGDALPASGIGQALALADRLDTLVGIFAAGGRPTGDRDPFGLRRAMIGVLRILIEGAQPLDLRELIEFAGEGLPADMQTAELAGEVLEFGLDRLRAWSIERGTRPDVFAAVRAVGPTVPLDFVARIEAVESFVQLPEAEALAAANKRVANLLRQAGDVLGTVVATHLQAPAEHALNDALGTIKSEVMALVARRRYTEALHALASLRGPVDDFFDSVMVMADDEKLRNNRLALLSALSALCRTTADIGELQ